MKIIKRIFALIILIPALLIFLGMIGGIVGSWAINNAITQAGVDVLTAGSDFVDGTLQSVSQVETLLFDAQTLVTQVEDEVERVGTDVTESTNILDDVADLVGIELDTVVNDIDTFFTSVQQTALAFANALDTIRRLPMVANSGAVQMDQNIFRDVADKVEELNNQLDSLIALVNRGKNGLTEEIVTELNDATTKINTQIGSLLSQIATINTDLTTLQTDLVDAQTGWAQVVDIFSIVLTIFFVLMALAFFSLTMHALAYFVKPDHTLRSLIPLERR